MEELFGALVVGGFLAAGLKAVCVWKDRRAQERNNMNTVSFPETTDEDAIQKVNKVVTELEDFKHRNDPEYQLKKLKKEIISGNAIGQRVDQQTADRLLEEGYTLQDVTPVGSKYSQYLIVKVPRSTQGSTFEDQSAPRAQSISSDDEGIQHRMRMAERESKATPSREDRERFLRMMKD